MTTDEVAEVLRIPKQTLYRWRTTGGGPEAIRVGRHLRFRAADVEQFLERSKTRSEEAMSAISTDATGNSRDIFLSREDNDDLPQNQREGIARTGERQRLHALIADAVAELDEGPEATPGEVQDG